MNFSQFAETLFDELFEDYAQHAEQWLDFEDYLKRGQKRIRTIVARHSKKIARLALDEHYRKFNNPPVDKKGRQS